MWVLLSPAEMKCLFRHLIAALEKGSKLEELVKTVRIRKGLKVSTTLGPVIPTFLILFIARNSKLGYILRQVVENAANSALDIKHFLLYLIGKCSMYLNLKASNTMYQPVRRPVIDGLLSYLGTQCFP